MFIPPQELLPLNEAWARLAAVAIMGSQDNQSIEYLSVRLELARQGGVFTLRQKIVSVTVETSRGSSWVHGWRQSNYDPPVRTYTRNTPVYAIRMLDLAQWAHRHGFSVASYYQPYLDLTAPSETGSEATKDEPTQATSGRMGGLAKGKTNAARDADIFKMYLDLKENISWASTIKHRLELRGITITDTRIRQIVKKMEESGG